MQVNRKSLSIAAVFFYHILCITSIKTQKANCAVVPQVVPRQTDVTAQYKNKVKSSTGNCNFCRSYADLVETLGPAVVNLGVAGVKLVTLSDILPSFDTPFLRFFGTFSQEVEGGHSFKKVHRSIGSGFIIADNGIILTNHHVIEDAGDIVVDMQDGRQFDASIISSDPKTDIAILKIKSNQKFPFIKLGDSDKARVGDRIVTISNPLGFGRTVTDGIISAKYRHIGSITYEDFIQTDASVNSGSSGGPMFNMDGEVIGIITACRGCGPNGPGNIGLNFAIPSNVAKSVLPYLMNQKEVKRPVIGITVAGVTSDISDAVGLKEVEGLLVVDVNKKSVASKAGIKIGDVILSFDGKKLGRDSSIGMMIIGYDFGSEIVLDIFRYGKRMKVPVVLEKQESVNQTSSSNSASKSRNKRIKVATVNPTLASEIGIAKDITGVLIEEINDSFLIRRGELKVSSIILRCNGIKINTEQEFYDFLAKLKKTGKKNAIVEFLSRSGNSANAHSVRFYE